MEEISDGKPIIHKIVLTGGPCGGKTTGQARLASFFEELGWKVYRVPETACTLMSGGVKWIELSSAQGDHFQNNLILTMLQIEQTLFDLADSNRKWNTLVICDRGVFDATTYMSKEAWSRLKATKGWNDVELRDKRYNQVVHMVTAANGAESFYSCEDHATRYETIPVARELDEKAAKAWVGHPYLDVIDNSTDFEKKIRRMISAVCNRVGIDVHDRLHIDSRKRKFLLLKTPDTKNFPCDFRDFEVVHDYLISSGPEAQQIRIRRRGNNDHWTFGHTVRRRTSDGQRVDLRMQMTRKDYEVMLGQACPRHMSAYKTRRCFLWRNQHYQLDIYQQPCHPRVAGLVLLETYTSREGPLELPEFLGPCREVTDDSRYSMYNLSLREEFVAPDEHFAVTQPEQIEEEPEI